MGASTATRIGLPASPWMGMCSRYPRVVGQHCAVHDSGTEDAGARLDAAVDIVLPNPGQG
jgi:hypothetical protein